MGAFEWVVLILLTLVWLKPRPRQAFDKEQATEAFRRLAECERTLAMLQERADVSVGLLDEISRDLVKIRFHLMPGRDPREAP